MTAIAVLLAAGATGEAAPVPAVRPGGLARWPGVGIEACALAGRRFAPLGDACYYPVDLLHPPGPLEVVRWRAGRRETARMRVTPFDYPVQRLTLPRHLVDLSAEDLRRVRRENAEVRRLWSRDGPRRFALPLAAPLDPLPVGGRFGGRRVINGRWRSPHGGADFSADEGRPVLAAADGVVAMVADHFFGGTSLFLDHGDRLVTQYFHLSRVDVSVGQEVRRGARVGAVGHTGRATGPHLHFGLRWRGARLNPELLLGDPERITTIE
jgi:murein DD-endopeptidase MepM/ murein hydrolase activator NlpD